MPTLYIFVGYPGSGKTTVAQIVCEASNAVHLWADDERRNMFDSPTHTSAESRALYDHLNDRTRQLLTTGKSVVFDTNFNFRKDRDHLRQIAADTAADIKLIWVRTGKELAKHRAVNDSHNKPTRLYGNMDDATFERIANNLQPPTSDENPIILIGENLQKADVLKSLKLS